MRTIRSALAAIAVSGLALAVLAADERRASPHETVSVNVGGALIAVTYGRPYMRGRLIMGTLVPYGVVWATGADEATTLTTTKALEFGSARVAPGRCSLWTLPSEGAWQLILNAQTGQWHTQYDAARDFGRVEMTKRTLAAAVEQLTITLVRSAPKAGVLRIAWETTEVSAPFTVVE